MMWAAVVLAKATVLLVAALVVLQLLRRTSAAVRHALCVCAMTGVLALPVIVNVVPQWRVAVLPGDAASVLPVVVGPPEPLPMKDGLERGGDVGASPARGASPSLPWMTLLWSGGVAAVLLWLFAGRVVLTRVRTRAVRVRGAWADALAAESADLGIRRDVRVLFSADVTAPLTWGVLQPTIVLPSEALEWHEERQRIVLRHELAHVMRRDALTQLGAGITCALYWFHPGAWWLSRRLRVERETACDDIVLAGGVSGQSYAHHLLDVARGARSLHPATMVSIGMASPSSFERRLLAVLDENTPRRRRALPRFAMPFLIAGLLGVTAFQPVPRVTTPAIAAPDLTAPQLTPPQLATPALDAATKAAHSEQALAILRARLDQFGVAERTVGRDTTVRFRAAPGGTLYLTLNAGGTIDIEGTNDDMVSVHAVAQSNAGGLRIEQVNGGVQVWSGANGTTPRPGAVPSFTIAVPRNYNIRIESSGGWVRIRNVNGSIRGRTEHGAIEIERAGGRLSLSTGRGDVNVADSNVSGEVRTDAGEVLFRNVKGGLRLTNGTGDVWYTAAEIWLLPDAKQTERDSLKRAVDQIQKQVAEIEKAHEQRVKEIQANIDLSKGARQSGGEIRLNSAAAGTTHETPGGNITIGRSSGDVSLRTGGGDIQVLAAHGALSAHTGGGDIEIRIDPANTQILDINASTGRGVIVLILPGNVSARLELDATYTDNANPADIESDFALSVARPLDWDTSIGTPRRHVIGTGVLGLGQGRIRVTSVNGNIILRRDR